MTYGSGLDFGGGASAPAHHSLLGNLVRAPFTVTEHLVEDVKNAALGLPTGLITLAEHPVRGIEDIGKTTWQDWSPLFHGHFAQFGEQLYAHPLAPLLDVAALFTGGAGAAAKVTNFVTRVEYRGALAAGLRGGDLEDSLSRTAKFGRPSDIVVKHPDGAVELTKPRAVNPAVRARQTFIRGVGHRAALSLPNLFGRFSPAGEFERLAAKTTSAHGAARQAVVGGQLAIGRMVESGKLIGEDPASAAHMVWGHFRPQFENHSIPVADESLLKVRNRRALNKQKGPLSTKQHLPSAAATGNVTVAYVKGGAVPAVKGAPKYTYHKAFRAPKGFLILKKDAGIPKSELDKLTAGGYFDTFVGKRIGSLNAGHVVKETDVYRDPAGSIRLVPSGFYTAYQREAANASRFMQVLVRKPTQVWKWMVLATRPAYFVNNFVGNSFMFLMMTNAYGPRALVDAYRNLYGDAATTRQLQGATRAYAKHLGQTSNVIEKWYGQTYKSGFSKELTDSVKVHGKAIRVLAKGFYPVTHLVAERYLRLAATHGLLRAQPEIRALLKQGYDFNAAVDHLSADAAFRGRIMTGVNDTLGDYHHLTSTELKIRNFVPFYTWDRAIARHGVKLALDKPARAAAVTQVGYQGVTTTKQYLGDIPDFLRGAVPLELLGFSNGGGRAGILTTQGLNPYATLPDVASGILALGPGGVKPSEAAASALGPIPTGAVEFFTGQSLLTGAALPKTPGGLIPSVISSQVRETPPGRLIERAITGTPTSKTGKDFLYQKDLGQEVRSFLGVPTKGLSTDQAATLAHRDAGIKKPRHRAGYGNKFLDTTY